MAGCGGHEGRSLVLVEVGVMLGEEISRAMMAAWIDCVGRPIIGALRLGAPSGLIHGVICGRLRRILSIKFFLGSRDEGSWSFFNRGILENKMF
jgi:hypothetical protein